MTITIVQHILLTLRYRIENYESMEGLFLQIKEAAINQRLNQRLWGLFIELMQILESVFGEIDGQDLFERIFQDPEAFGRLARLLNFSEIDEAA